MKAVELITKAGELVGGDRAVTHGDKHTNFENIARYWNAHIAAKQGSELTGADVGYMMAMMKIARTHTGSQNDDDAIDGIGYIACAGEIAAKRR